MTYILGLCIPKLGRRFILLLPMLGTTIQISIWLLIIYFHLSEYWWYIASFIVSVSGADNVRNFVLNLFITENTIENERSSGFVIFGAISTIVSAVGTFVIGYYIAWQAGLSIIPLILNICLWFVSRWMLDEEGDQPEESNMEPTTASILADWPFQIEDSNSLLVPQPSPNQSRSNSIISMDFHIIDIHNANTRGSLTSV